MSNPNGIQRQAAFIAIKWKQYRDAHYKLYEITNDLDGYKKSMAFFQSIISKWMVKHDKNIIQSVTEICSTEEDARVKVKFICAGYELISGNGYHIDQP